MPVSGQVQNPVPLLPEDNNGVLVEFNAVPSGGDKSSNGSLVLGIGTGSNNTPPGSYKAGVIPLDQYLDFTTVLNYNPKVKYTTSFIDTGSNGLFFPQVSANNPQVCSDAPGWYCPEPAFSNAATLDENGGSQSVTVNFSVESFDSLAKTGNNVFSNIGGTASDGNTFDWGLPYFLGQDVFIAISGAATSLGTGPYFASGLYNGSQPSGDNVMPISVNGYTGLPNVYYDKPLVSVTVCTPGTNTCKTVDGILLDTGSFGLRIFKQALNVLSLTPETTSLGGQLAECQQYADGTADWGPVELADVQLGGEPVIHNMPIQVIDPTFEGSANCNGGTNLDSSPSVDGYNAILGVGSFQQDCGTRCANANNITPLNRSNWPYWSCK